MLRLSSWLGLGLGPGKQDTEGATRKGLLALRRSPCTYMSPRVSAPSRVESRASHWPHPSCSSAAHSDSWFLPLKMGMMLALPSGTKKSVSADMSLGQRIQSSLVLRLWRRVRGHTAGVRWSLDDDVVWDLTVWLLSLILNSSGPEWILVHLPSPEKMPWASQKLPLPRIPHTCPSACSIRRW